MMVTCIFFGKHGQSTVNLETKLLKRGICSILRKLALENVIVYGRNLSVLIGTIQCEFFLKIRHIASII